MLWIIVTSVLLIILIAGGLCLYWKYYHYSSHINRSGDDHIRFRIELYPQKNNPFSARFYFQDLKCMGTDQTQYWLTAPGVVHMWDLDQQPYLLTQNTYSYFLRTIDTKIIQYSWVPLYLMVVDRQTHAVTYYQWGDTENTWIPKASDQVTIVSTRTQPEHVDASWTFIPMEPTIRLYASIKSPPHIILSQEN